MDDERERLGRMLDELRDRADWDDDRRFAVLDDAIARFEPEVVARAVRPRLADLSGRDGEVLIALVESLAQPELLETLARAVADQPGLAPDRLWLAFDALEGTGLVEADPDLLQRRDDLDEMIEAGDPLEDLVSQIGSDPASIPAAIEALREIEPEIREEILAGLEARSANAAARAFLTQWGGARGLSVVDRTPRLLASAIGSLDGEGRGGISLALDSADGRSLALSAVCDVLAGVVDFEVREEPTPEGAAAVVSGWADSLRGDIVRDRHDAATRLLLGVARLSAEDLGERVAAILEQVARSPLASRPIANDQLADWVDPAGDASDDAALVLGRRPGWLDDSDLVRELSRGWRLNEASAQPDPALDPGPFRVLFEGRIAERVGLYRDLLAWSAIAWEADGDLDAAAAAYRLAFALSDPQNAVPSHPFLSTLMAMSLGRATAAQA